MTAYFCFLCLFLCGKTRAERFAALAKDTVNWRMGPNIQHDQKFIFEKALSWPVIIIRKKDDFYLVRDYLGREGWIKKKMLRMCHVVLTTQNNVPLYQEPKAASHKRCLLHKGCFAQFIKRHEKNPEWSMIRVKTPQGKNITGWVQSCYIWPML